MVSWTVLPPAVNLNTDTTVSVGWPLSSAATQVPASFLILSSPGPLPPSGLFSARAPTANAAITAHAQTQFRMRVPLPVVVSSWSPPGGYPAGDARGRGFGEE